MVLNFYFYSGSIPCGVARMTAQAIGVNLHLIPVDLTIDENRSLQFRKINPQCTVPVLIDDGLVISESRAIMLHLIEKYAKTDSLYSKDPKIRAKIHEFLFFDCGTLYARFADYYYPAMVDNLPPKQEHFHKLDEAVGYLNDFLSGHTLAVEDNFTVADLSLLGTVAGLEVVGFNFDKYSNITDWYARVKSLSRLNGLQILEAHIEKFKKLFPRRF